MGRQTGLMHTICQRNEQSVKETSKRNVQAYRMGGQTGLMYVICQRYEQTYVQSYRMGGQTGWMHAIFKVRNEGKKGLNKSFPLTVNGTLLVMPVCPSISLVCTYIRLFVISLQRYIQQSKQPLQLFNSRRIDCNHRQQKIDRVHGELQLKMIALLFALLYHSTTDISWN